MNDDKEEVWRFDEKSNEHSVEFDNTFIDGKYTEYVPLEDPKDRARQLHVIEHYVSNTVHVLNTNIKSWIGQRFKIQIGKYKGYTGTVIDCIIVACYNRNDGRSYGINFMLEIDRKDGSGTIAIGPNYWTRVYYAAHDLETI